MLDRVVILIPPENDRWKRSEDRFNIISLCVRQCFFLFKIFRERVKKFRVTSVKNNSRPGFLFSNLDHALSRDRFIYLFFSVTKRDILEIWEVLAR